MRASVRPAVMTVAIVLAAAHARAEPAWQLVTVKHGVRYEKRAVAGSRYFEHRATFEVPRPPEAAIALVWSLWREGSLDHAGTREHLKRTDDEIVVYDRIVTPVVRDREVTLRLVRTREPLGLRFESRNDLGPPPTPGYVQLPIVRGQWVMEPIAGGTRLTFTCYSEPGGSVPALLVRGALQSQVIRDAERLRTELR